MTYSTHTLTGAVGSPTLAQMWAIASLNNVLVLFANPSQDVWTVDLDSYIATEVRNGRALKLVLG